MAIKGIAVDFFDVLCMDTQRAWLEREGFTRSGVFAEASDLLDEGKIDYPEYLRRYSGASGKTPDEIHSFLSQTVIDHDVASVLTDLKPRYAIALASNAPSESVRPRLNAHGLNELLDVVVVSGEVGVRKPTAAFFDLLVEQMGLHPEEVLFIDDNTMNCVGAQAAGLPSLHFTGHTALRSALDAYDIAV